MYRMIEINDDVDQSNPLVVCNGEQDTPECMDGFFLSRHHRDIEEYAMLYKDAYTLLLDAQRLQNILPSTDIGIQSLAANGKWYLYDFNNQCETVTDLVNMK